MSRREPVRYLAKKKKTVICWLTFAPQLQWFLFEKTLADDLWKLFFSYPRTWTLVSMLRNRSICKPHQGAYQWKQLSWTKQSTQKWEVNGSFIDLSSTVERNCCCFQTIVFWSSFSYAATPLNIITWNRQQLSHLFWTLIRYISLSGILLKAFDPVLTAACPSRPGSLSPLWRISFVLEMTAEQLCGVTLLAFSSLVWSPYQTDTPPTENITEHNCLKKKNRARLVSVNGIRWSCGPYCS